MEIFEYTYSTLLRICIAQNGHGIFTFSRPMGTDETVRHCHVCSPQWRIVHRAIVSKGLLFFGRSRAGMKVFSESRTCFSSLCMTI